MAVEYLTPLDPQAYTILVVDDTPNNLKVIIDYLTEIGFRVLMARSGKSGLQRAQHGLPDIILLDVLMAGMDGFETCRQLKADERTQNIPVIFMTALTETEHKIKAFEMGAVDYVTKPIRHEEVLARITTHLRIRDLTHNLEQIVAARTRELEQSLQREQLLARELQRALANETELSRLKSQVIEVVSHEFRTPLTIIAQSSQLLQSYYKRLSKERREVQFYRIEESISFIEKLLTDMMLINTANRSEIEVKRVPADFSTFCVALEKDLSAGLEPERVMFTYEPVNCQLVVDIELVKQIASNLLSNALKFSTPESKVQVTICIDAAVVVITVMDEGIGIPIAAQDQIFDIFYRADNVDARRGLGIGLYIARRLAEVIGGQIAVESAGVDQGSTFILRFPKGGDHVIGN